LISLDFLDKSFIQNSITFIKYSINNNNIVCLYSIDENRIREHTVLVDKINSESNQQKVYIMNRTKINSIASSDHKNFFVVIGKKNKDFELAVNNKLLFLTPTWLDNIEDKAYKYAIKIKDYLQLKNFLDTLNNQKTWYSSNTLPDGTYIYSLADSRYNSYARSLKEREIDIIFENILKKGSLYQYEIYLYHFLSSVSNYNHIFNDINHWGIFPSSNGKLLGNEMFNFKEKVRYMMKGQPLRAESYKEYPNILIRHTSRSKTHGKLSPQVRISNGCKLHFPTICLNPAYKNKIIGKNVCIFDDYLTHGNSFETTRNLLRKAGAKKIVFVTLGTYMNKYQYQNYELYGDIFSKNYDYKLINRSEISSDKFSINKNAKIEVENLYNIFNL
ncbi:phosphoribosyltransferase, partial [Clostridioides difficile]|nr:phosphoribosyltransferase [Clostridioides difficile]